MKTILLLVFIAVLGTFIYIKVELLGDPQSNFNQTTRYSLGKHATLRTLFALNSVGDARAEFFSGDGAITIKWYKPLGENENYVNQALMSKFAEQVEKYTGRPTQLVSGGSMRDSTVPIDNLAAYQLVSQTQKTKGTLLLVFFLEDYSPRPEKEISTTYKDSGMAISLSAHRQFLSGFNVSLDQYLLTSMLHEFGHQIGLEHNSDFECIMSTHAGINEEPVEVFGHHEPQDFCPQEVKEINQLKAQYAQ